jgi:hypothetical protein
VGLGVASGWWRRLGFYWFDVEYEFDKRACYHCGSEMRWEVMVKEELTAHDVEGNIMSSPG